MNSGFIDSARRAALGIAIGATLVILMILASGGIAPMLGLENALPVAIKLDLIGLVVVSLRIRPGIRSARPSNPQPLIPAD